MHKLFPELIEEVDWTFIEHWRLLDALYGQHKGDVMLIAIAAIRAQIHSWNWKYIHIIDACGIFKIESNGELEHSQ